MAKNVTVYDVNEVARGHLPDKTLRDYIKDLILVEDGTLWSLMEPYFIPPGKEGRRDFDHALAVAQLKRFSNLTAKEKKMPDPLETHNTAYLIPHLLKVLGTIGFMLSHGKIVGLKKDTENGTPVTGTPTDVGHRDLLDDSDQEDSAE